jgi:hypothetical protein
MKRSYRTQLLSNRPSLLGDGATCAKRRLALNEHEVALILGNWVVAHALGDGEHFTLPELDDTTFHLDAQVTPEDEEQLILVLVAVPRQGP